MRDIIYIVTQGKYSDYHICGVFKTQEDADNFVASLTPEDKSFWDKPEIEVWHAGYDVSPNHKLFFVRLERDTGDVIECRQRGNFYPDEDYWDGGGFDINDNFYAKLFAVDEKAAIKIANERRIAALSRRGTNDV